MLDWIKQIAASSRDSYGARRMQKSLAVLGYSIGLRKTKRLMKEACIFLRYRKKYKVTTHSQHDKPLFDNLLNRQFCGTEPDRAYAGDITHDRRLVVFGGGD